MKIWLVTIGEPMPTDGTNERLMRTGMLANILVERGHEVVWWTSTFDHARKRHRFEQDSIIEVNDFLQIKYLHGSGYKKNISLKRLIDHYLVARKFKRYARSERPPQVILCSLPPLELCLEIAKYGKSMDVPVVLDVRDLWPDIFLEVVPPRFQKIAKLAFQPMFSSVRWSCRQAKAIISITPPLVEWGVKYANRPATNWDQDFPHGYTELKPSVERIEQANDFWGKLGVGESQSEFVICFFAGMGLHIEIETVIDAARDLQQLKRHAFRFVLCGNFEKQAKLAQDCQNVVFPGWVGAAEIWTLMRRSTVGIVPIRSRLDFTLSIPNKAIEYMSAGLPVVSSLQGYLSDILSTHRCGLTYDNEDPDSLIDVLQKLKDDPQLVHSFAENALRLYQGKFTATKVYNNMANYLEKISCY